MTEIGIERERKSHIWKRQTEEWYQEPPWVSKRLFDVERFDGEILDPCAGGGNIVRSAEDAGYYADGWDIADRGFMLRWQGNFLDRDFVYPNVVCNPPFNIAQKFAIHALKGASYKVAMIFPTARLNAARWLEETPLARIWLLTPRPSMPPGESILRGEKPGGGKVDFCWLVWNHAHKGHASIAWLRRDG